MPAEAVAGLGGALGGVVLGVILTTVFQLWLRVLDAQSAARIIRMETVENRDKVGLGLKGKMGDLRLQDGAWLQHRITLAPVLGEEELSRLFCDYSFIGQAQLFLRASPPSSQTAARWAHDLRNWQEALREHGRLLRRIERSSRWRLLWRLLFPKPIRVTPTDDEVNQS